MHPVEYEILDADFVKHRLDVLKAAVCAAFIELASKDDRALSVVLEKLGVLLQNASSKKQCRLSVVAEALHFSLCSFQF